MEKSFIANEKVGHVAGTLVHTKRGLVPIEQIQAGDLVLSQPEQTGALAYKQVEETFVSDDAETWLVEYRMTDLELESRDEFDYDAWREEIVFGDEKNTRYKTGYLVATGNHTVWVKGEGWTRVDALAENLDGVCVMLSKDGKSVVVSGSRPMYKSAIVGVGVAFEPATGCVGPRIDLRDGKIVVCAIDAQNASDIQFVQDSLCFVDEIPLTQKVYNFRVAEFSTYYVGEEGILVSCTNLAKQKFAK